jgi:glycosyltransferase involved in cell wall biosynthesis
MLIGIDGNEANIKNRVGVNQYAFDLLHALSKLKTQHRFVVYLKNPPLPDLPQLNIASWEYRIIPFPKLWTQTRLPWDLFVHNPRPDVFFSPSHYGPRWSPVPSVISIMDLGFLSTRSQFNTKDYNQLTRWTEYSVMQAKKILAISEFTKKDIVSYYHKNPDDITVSYLAYDEQMFKPAPNPKVPLKYGIHKPYILFLSSLKPSKNVEGLVKAFFEFKKNYKRKDLALVIAGKKAWLYEQIFELVKKLDLSGDVIFTGFVDETDVPALMTEAQAFAMPSFFEGFGIPVLEAMACGTPVIVSNVASLPEVAGNAGIFVDPKDPSSIAQGIREAFGKDRNRYISLGLSQVKKFSWSKCAQETLEVIESCKIN